MAVLNTSLPDLTLLSRGKVRDVYEVSPDELLFVASDRLSAFDVVMTNGIPLKGRILTQISAFWFDFLADACPNHVITCNVDEMPESVRKYRSEIDGRCMLVRRLQMLPIEVIVRGYITGSGWKEYLATGAVCGIVLPKDMKECDKLPQPLFTPSTKAEVGVHGECGF
eukprot:Opistho-2@24124